MQVQIVQPSARSAAIRVFGATSVLLAVLVITVLVAQPEMMRSAMHAAMNFIFVP